MTTIGDTEHVHSGVPLREWLCQRAIEHFGRFGFDESMLEMSIATDVDVIVLEEFFGSVDGLRAACDDHIAETVRIAKTEALTSRDPNTWSTQLASIESYAPLMAYLVRALEAGDAPSRKLLQRMTEGIEGYMAAAVDAGTVRPTPDPKGRARALAMFGAGGFLMYRRMHPNPEDMGAVLRDYAKDVFLPTLELYTYGLMTDDTMYRVFTERPSDTTAGDESPSA